MEYWCQCGSTRGDLCCTCFLIDCLLQLRAMKRGFIHHPAVMSFYMETQFRVRASLMGCLWKKTQTEQQSCLIIWPRCRAGEIWDQKGCGCYQWFLQFYSLHMLCQYVFLFYTWCLIILFYCDNTADSHPGVSHAHALMSCAPACACGDYHLQRHWSQQGTNRKEEERWPTTATVTRASAQKRGHAAKFKVFF